jgi:hypothetical protein
VNIEKTYCSVSVHLLAVLSKYQAEDSWDGRDTVADEPIDGVETPKLFCVVPVKENEHNVESSSACPPGVCLHEPLLPVSFVLFLLRSDNKEGKKRSRKYSDGQAKVLTILRRNLGPDRLRHWDGSGQLYQ